MYYLGITVADGSSEVVEKLTEIADSFAGSFRRLYKAQHRLEGTESKRWTTLLLVRLADDQLLEKESPILKDSQAKLSTAIIRIELLEETPNSFLVRDSARKGITIIEHVAVRDASLHEFKQIMIQNNTPAMAYILRHKKWCNEFIALETGDVLYHNENYNRWNQIHLINMTVSAPFRYKKDFNEGLKRAGAPNFDENFARLKEIREFTYKVKCKRIES